MIIIKMSEQARADYAKLPAHLKTRARETEWHYHPPATLSAKQKSTLCAVGIDPDKAGILNTVVLGNVVPSEICRNPYIQPAFFDAMPEEADIWAALEGMAKQMPEASAQSRDETPPETESEVVTDIS